MKFNLNDVVRVRLTPKGRAIHAANHAMMCAEWGGKKIPYVHPVEDSDGWSEWQAWELMREFGSHLYAGANLPFAAEIEIKEKQQ